MNLAAFVRWQPIVHVARGGTDGGDLETANAIHVRGEESPL
jgi:hypothetical protein